MMKGAARSRNVPKAEARLGPWTTRKLLAWMTSHFEAKGVDSPRVVAEMLLAHVLGCERMRLYMEADRPASPLELSTLRGLVARAAAHEPVQYLVGHAWFFSRRFDVDRSTLIPRPSTETLVEHVLQWLRVTPGHASPLIADIGTGTGCIAISLAVQLPEARIVASDIVPASLDLARRNARTHGVEDRIDFHVGSGFEPLRERFAHERFEVIAANPPYISDAEWGDVPPNVKDYEPASALRGGADGLDVVRGLITGAADHLADGGQLVMEIAASQGKSVLALAHEQLGLGEPVVLKDHEGLPRVLVTTRRERGQARR
jgi:release factor glutamine methyltransferase